MKIIKLLRTSPIAGVLFSALLGGLWGILFLEGPLVLEILFGSLIGMGILLSIILALMVIRQLKDDWRAIK